MVAAVGGAGCVPVFTVGGGGCVPVVTVVGEVFGHSNYVHVGGGVVLKIRINL